MPLIKNDKDEWVNFIHIPKNAGSSIEKIFASKYDCAFMPVEYSGRIVLVNGVSIQHINKGMQDAIGVELIAKKSFAITRCPYERIVSEYKYRCGNINSLKRLMSLDCFIYYCLRYKKKNKFIFDGHILPQWTYLNDSTDVFKIKDMSVLLMHMKTNLHFSKVEEIVHLNRTKSDGIGFNKISKELIDDFYNKDFEFLEYDKCYNNVTKNHHGKINIIFRCFVFDVINYSRILCRMIFNKKNS